MGRVCCCACRTRVLRACASAWCVGCVVACVCVRARPARGLSVQGLHLQIKPECPLHTSAHASTCGGPCGARGFAGAAQRVRCCLEGRACAPSGEWGSVGVVHVCSPRLPVGVCVCEVCS